MDPGADLLATTATESGAAAGDWPAKGGLPAQMASTMAVHGAKSFLNRRIMV
jgi:hypothetical protein